jgi:succinate dehydrogenase / fumarate reductase, cytochrome b subunit
MSELTKKSRPQFRNINITDLRQYRLPAAGIMSILHRVSGAAMFLLLPLIIWIFDLSLTSELSYAQLMEFTASPIIKIILCGLAWAFIHHLFAGIRHLVCDMHVGLTKEQSALWSKAVVVGALLVSVIAWLKIFGVL